MLRKIRQRHDKHGVGDKLGRPAHDAAWRDDQATIGEEMESIEPATGRLGARLHHLVEILHIGREAKPRLQAMRHI